MKHYVHTILPALLLGASLFAQAQELIPRARFFQAKDIHSVALSKDGRRVYYQRHSAGDQHIYYVEASQPEKEARLSAGAPIKSWATTYDGRILAQVADQGARQRLLLLDHKGSAPKNLTPFPLLNVRIEAQRLQSPNLVALWLVGEDPNKDGIYLLDLRQGEAHRISPRLPYASIYYDGQLQPRAARRVNELGGITLYVRPEKEWVELARYPYDEGMYLGGLQDIVSVSADGRRVYFTDNLGRDKTALVEMNFDSNEQRVLIADPRVDILPAGAFVNNDGWPCMTQGIHEAPRRHYSQGETRRDFEWLEAQFGPQFAFVEASADGRTWLLQALDGERASYYLFRRNRRTITHLFDEFPKIGEQSPARRYAHLIKTRDGVELPIHVYLPAGVDSLGDGRPDTLMPLILYVHGGPWTGVNHWNNWQHIRHFQLLANRGYVVINTEFRGVAGMGKEMVRRGDREWGGAMHRDLVDIAEWAVQQRIADPARIGVWGWSYGGYAAAAALALSPGRFACAMSMYGPYDLEAFARTPFANNPRWRGAVGDPNTDDGVALLRRHSPYHLASRIRQPILLTTGAKDDRIPKNLVDAFADTLVAAGKEVVYFFYPDEGHEFQSPSAWISFWAIAERFLADHLGGRFQPPGDDLKRSNHTHVYGKGFAGGLE